MHYIITFVCSQGILISHTFAWKKAYWSCTMGSIARPSSITNYVSIIITYVSTAIALYTDCK